MATPEKVTEAQAAEALRALVESGGEDEPEAAPEPETPAVEEPAAAAEAEPAPVEVTAPAESDDVASLKQRLQERDDQLKKAETIHEARWKAIQERSAANERILRERFLK